MITQGAELLENQLHTDPHKLHQLGIRTFVRLQALVAVDPDTRDFRQIPHDFPDLAGQAACILNGAAAQTVQEALTPLRLCDSSRVEGGFVLGQQQIELHLGAL